MYINTYAPACIHVHRTEKNAHCHCLSYFFVTGSLTESEAHSLSGNTLPGSSWEWTYLVQHCVSTADSNLSPHIFIVSVLIY